MSDSTENNGIYELYSMTDGHPTNSKDMQDALDKIDADPTFKALHFNPGSYIIDGSVKACPYSILGVPSNIEVYGDLSLEGNPLVYLTLMQNAPLDPFNCDVSIFGPKEDVGKNIKIYNLFYNGTCPVSGGLQKYMKEAVCPGSKGGAGKETGKSFHNFISAVRKSFKDCEFHHIWVRDTAGDGFRTSRWTQSSGLYLHDWIIYMCGHCGILLENTVDSIIENIDVTCRSNGAFRTQNGCKGITAKDIRARGDSMNYNPGFQITGSNITISGCVVDSMMGPGIEVCGADDKDINIEDCEIINCGTFVLTTNYNVAGILWNGASGSIKRCKFDNCYQNSISTNIYQPDDHSYTGSGFILNTEDNQFLDTKPSKFSNISGNGKHIGNTLSGHQITSKGNVFVPATNMTLNVKFYD